MEGYEEQGEPDYSEEMAKDAWMEEQNAKDEYEAMQDANARAEGEAQEQAAIAEAEYYELHKDCISKIKVKEAVLRHGTCVPNNCQFVESPRGNCWKKIIEELGL